MPLFQKMIFQFPSAKYEIIVLPILPAKLERRRNTTAKSCVCNTRKETVTFLYSLIIEINLEVDTEASMGRASARRGEKQASKSMPFKSFPMHEFGNTSRRKVEQPMFCYLNSAVQKGGKQKLSARFKFRRGASAARVKVPTVTLKYTADDERGTN